MPGTRCRVRGAGCEVRGARCRVWVLRSRGCNIHYLRKILVFFGGETQFRDFISRWKELGLRFSANLKPFIGSLYFLAHQSLQKGKFEQATKKQKQKLMRWETRRKPLIICGSAMGSLDVVGTCYRLIL